jgi:hypothetical protein
VAAALGVHPDALDLPDLRGQRPDLGLEHDLAVLEPRERTSGGDQLRHAGAVADPAVAEPRVDTDLLGEHCDGGR